MIASSFVLIDIFQLMLKSLLRTEDTTFSSDISSGFKLTGNSMAFNVLYHSNIYTHKIPTTFRFVVNQITVMTRTSYLITRSSNTEIVQESNTSGMVLLCSDK